VISAVRSEFFTEAKILWRITCRLLALALIGAHIAACVTRPTRPLSDAQNARGQDRLDQREAQLREVNAFRLRGRIAISDGKDSGSGRFEWDQRSAGFTLNFTAPVTGQNWRLESQPGQAVLIESNGAVRVAEDAQSLLARELNWQLPTAAMRYWVLGSRAPGSESSVEFNSEGQLSVLRQNGWEIRYPAFDVNQDPPLPTKVFARSGEHQVRISVRNWSLH